MLYVLKSCQRSRQFSCFIKYTLHCVSYQTSAKPVILKKQIKNVSEKRKGRHSVAVLQPIQDKLFSEKEIQPSSLLSKNNPPWEEIKFDWKKLPSEYLKLSKIRLTSLVVMTSMAGYAMAPASFDFVTFSLCSVGTGLLSCAANAINQYHEVPFDAQMARTRNRILVRGIITPVHALGFAAVCSASGLAVLYFGVNGITALLGCSNLILYTSVYTPLKRISIINTWVGSIVGALPPLMGWASCTGGLELGAWVLAGILYAWQFPHFNALSWNLRPEYSRAGYRMMAVTDPGLCRRTALRYTLAIIALSCSAPLLDVTNIWFALESLPLNIYFGYLAWQFYKESDSSTSRQLFRFSLIHLPLLMILMLINKKKLHTVKDSENGEKTINKDEVRSRGLNLVVTPTNTTNSSSSL
ncbi:cytochrome c oxidase assembly factor 10 [Lycorma delicatula]|uniref:cytochrome c oxidase assembly factor 10 n=1 Tax=Lycorma delicatula TaxID=130591 RepID=UPI003F513B61